MNRSSVAAAIAALVLLGAATTTGAAPPPVNFGSPALLGVATLPYSVALGDVNGDGRLDIVAANLSSNSVSVLLGNGLGGFASKVDYVTGSGPYFLALGDLNRDGMADVVVANEFSDNISVLRATGSGGLAAKVDYPSGSSPLSVALADLNGDGMLDVVATNEHASNVSVWRGNGDGTLVSQGSIGSAPDPFVAAIGDFDRNGKPDLAVASVSTNVIWSYPGRGDLTFGAASSFFTGSTPYGLAVADLNGDGWPDLVVANAGSNNVSVYFGSSTGQFGPKTDLATANAPHSVVAQDFNGDGIPDLAIACFSSGVVTVLSGRGDGTFTSGVDFVVGANPTSIAAGDVNGDGHPDLAVSLAGGNAVAVLLNTSVIPTLPTSVTLTASPNPSAYGQLVTLTARLSDLNATGSVEFDDGAVALGTAPVLSATATMTVSSLVHRTHVLLARYSGDAVYRPALSDTVFEYVALAASQLAVTATANPALQHQPVGFLATLTAMPPNVGVATGTVAFTLDGLPFGTPVTLVNNQAASATLSTLTPGAHAFSAAFVPSDTLRFAASASPTLPLEVTGSDPVLLSVKDVPADQGGRVFLRWRCPLDQPGVSTVTGYRVWRRVPPDVTPAPAARSSRTLRGARPDSSARETFWEALATLPSAQLVSYGYTAPTTQDSMLNDNPYTAFFVQALTADASAWFDSAPDSGYSVDNLAPPPPSSFVARYRGYGAELHWTPSRAPDVSLYRLHRGATADFVPSASNLVATLADTGYVDASGGEGYCYKLAAADVHGNVGRYDVIVPSGATAALATFLAPELDGGSANLRWYLSSDAAFAITVWRRGVEEGWAPLGPASVDGEGYVTYVDTDLVPAARLGYRLGLALDSGPETFTGEGWIDVPAGGADLAVHVPNPVVSGDVLVSMAAPPGRAVKVELFDLAGRQVAVRTVEGGLGRRSIRLARAADVAPGVYLVRVGLERPVVARVAILR